MRRGDRGDMEGQNNFEVRALGMIEASINVLDL
jgi:hypothetical protein